VKTVIRMLDGAKYLERLDTPPRTWALLFERGGEAFVALWSLDDSWTATLGDVSMVKGVTSMVGTPVLIAGRSMKSRAGPST